MEANKILQADVLDIIFEGKNKSYGAYELRKSYNRRLGKALIITGSLLILVFIGTLFANYITSTSNTLDVADTQLAEIKTDEPPPPPPPPPPPTPPPPPEIKQVQFTPPVVAKDEEVQKPIEEIKDSAAISTKTVETDNTNQVVQAPVENVASQAVEIPKAINYDSVFIKVEKEAQFPGGDAGWRNYVTKNINPQTPADNGAPEGSYTVMVRFLVSRDGSISEVSAETSLGYGMEAEAVKVIKKGPKWTPGVQNGRNVTSWRRQPITYVVGGEQ